MSRLNRAALFLRASKRDLLHRKVVVRVREMAMEVPADRMWAFPRAEYFERNVVHWFDELLDECDAPVVYDVGANCGYFSLRAAGRARAVYAFEPASETFETLARNVERNRLGHVVPLRAGLSDRRGHGDLHLYSSSGDNSLYERTIVNRRVGLVGSERVSLSRLDDVVREEGLLAPDLIKIDAEGSEPKVLSGAIETLRRHHPTILMEHNAPLAADAGYTLDQIVALLAPLGYRLTALTDDQHDIRLHPVRVLSETRSGTIVARPRNGL